MLINHVNQLKKLNQYQQDKEFQKKRQNKGEEHDESVDEDNDTKGGYEPTEKSYEDHEEEEIMNKYNLKPQKNKGTDE